MALGQMLLKFHYTFGTSGWYPKKYTECMISKQSALCMGELGSCRDSLGEMLSTNKLSGYLMQAAVEKL